MFLEGLVETGGETDCFQKAWICHWKEGEEIVPGAFRDQVEAFSPPGTAPSDLHLWLNAADTYLKGYRHLDA